MADWEFAQKDVAEELALLHQFSVKENGVEFVITVKEFAAPPMPAMKYLAVADKQVNQKGAPIIPTGFGSSMHTALTECLNAIRRYSYEP